MIETAAAIWGFGSLALMVRHLKYGPPDGRTVAVIAIWPLVVIFALAVWLLGEIEVLLHERR